MHPAVEPYLTQPDEPIQRTGSTRAETGRYTLCGAPLGIPPNRTVVSGNLQADGLPKGFVLSMPRSRTLAHTGRRFGTHRLWQRQSQIGGQWLCMTSARR